MSLLDASLREQAAAVAGGEADPAELLAATLSRIEDRNPSVNAIVATFPDQSRQMLAAAPSGPLRGVPVAIKDEWPLPWRAEQLGAAGARRTFPEDPVIRSLPGASGRRPLVRDRHRHPAQRAARGRGGHLPRLVRKGLDDGVDARVAVLDPRQGGGEQLGRVASPPATAAAAHAGSRPAGSSLCRRPPPRDMSAPGSGRFRRARPRSARRAAAGTGRPPPRSPPSRLRWPRDRPARARCGRSAQPCRRRPRSRRLWVSRCRHRPRTLIYAVTPQPGPRWDCYSRGREPGRGEGVEDRMPGTIESTTGRPAAPAAPSPLRRCPRR